MAVAEHGIALVRGVVVRAGDHADHVSMAIGVFEGVVVADQHQRNARRAHAVERPGTGLELLDQGPDILRLLEALGAVAVAGHGVEIDIADRLGVVVQHRERIGRSGR
ncbi:MAG: hypothetical protein IPP28_00260 [Xanthomonadales bacterium]|nr:hypothetical protein [Xanthomonadales bacterium]